MLTHVSEKYSSSKNELISVTLKSSASVDDLLKNIKQIQQTVSRYLGCKNLHYIHHYHIKNALPCETTSKYQENNPEEENILCAGDWTEQGSINGAVKSGKIAAEKACLYVKKVTT